MRYWPSALVTVVRTTPVFVFVVVIVTPGRTASPASSTRPLKVLVVCPRTSPDVSIRIDVVNHSTRRIIKPSSILRTRIVPSSPISRDLHDPAGGVYSVAILGGSRGDL